MKAERQRLVLRKRNQHPQVELTYIQAAIHFQRSVKGQAKEMAIADARPSFSTERRPVSRNHCRAAIKPRPISFAILAHDAQGLPIGSH
jgi:hypothetical protein